MEEVYTEQDIDKEKENEEHVREFQELNYARLTPYYTGDNNTLNSYKTFMAFDITN